MKISNYAIDDKGTTSNTENISNIIDKLIRITAKITECYASDITYDIENLNDAVKHGTELDVLLFFREHGVTTRGARDFNDEAYDWVLFSCTPIQVWRLTHNPSTMETKLIRVSIRKEGF